MDFKLLYVQSVKEKKKQNTPINFNASYGGEMELVPITLIIVFFNFIL